MALLPEDKMLVMESKSLLIYDLAIAESVDDRSPNLLNVHGPYWAMELSFEMGIMDRCISTPYTLANCTRFVLLDGQDVIGISIPCGNAIHELPQKSILLRGNRDYFLQRRSRLSYHLALGDWRKGRVQTVGYDWDNEHCSKIAYRKYRSSHNRSCRPTIDSASGRVVVADCNRRRHSVMDFGLSVIE